MKVKTSELTRHALDWAVARAERHDTPDWMPEQDIILLRNYVLLAPFSPSTDWSQGGPIIEREKIMLIADDGKWGASIILTDIPHEGPTPLIAAMRCFVASVKGEYVDIPEELMA